MHFYLEVYLKHFLNVFVFCDNVTFLYITIVVKCGQRIELFPILKTALLTK